MTCETFSVLLVASYSFGPLLAVWFVGGKTMFDDGVLGLPHDLTEQEQLQMGLPRLYRIE